MFTSPYILLELITGGLRLAFMPGIVFLIIRRWFLFLLNFTTIFCLVNFLATEDSPALVIFTVNLADCEVAPYLSTKE